MIRQIVVAACIAVSPVAVFAQESDPQANVQLIQDYYAAYATGDPEAVRPFLHEEVVWRIPGHHPMAGDKEGPDEVIAFFTGLARGNFGAEPMFFQAQGDMVVDIHRGFSQVGAEPEVDQLYALMFRIEDGQIIEAQNFLTDMYESDRFFWAHYPLKPLPNRLAE
ncbi:MAG: nuclear transport factor 2 family protein [Erythrobacter sp.]|jgi:ketosteroid isomerase-like protein|nr:nuclear transport factor 2 family protein [Erythrobacter sp.]